MSKVLASLAPHLQQLDAGEVERFVIAAEDYVGQGDQRLDYALVALRSRGYLCKYFDNCNFIEITKTKCVYSSE